MYNVTIISVMSNYESEKIFEREFTFDGFVTLMQNLKNLFSYMGMRSVKSVAVFEGNKTNALQFKAIKDDQEIYLDVFVTLLHDVKEVLNVTAEQWRENK